MGAGQSGGVVDAVADQGQPGAVLLQGESNVACLAELADAAPTAVSQHLAKLRLAGLVKGRREGTFVYYSAADERVRRLLSEGLFHADHLDQAGHAEAGVDTPPSERVAAHAHPAR
ncbi:ArsR/SmtB family transcription factor [Streptosporangium canum]|uniref:ArsR/SmtB family transcription factor n=1 Tax=Streptosporangium canum TaxID=324952 RepID=UPI003793BC67